MQASGRTATCLPISMRLPPTTALNHERLTGTALRGVSRRLKNLSSHHIDRGAHKPRKKEIWRDNLFLSYAPFRHVVTKADLSTGEFSYSKPTRHWQEQRVVDTT